MSENRPSRRRLLIESVLAGIVVFALIAIGDSVIDDRPSTVSQWIGMTTTAVLWCFIYYRLRTYRLRKHQSDRPQ